MATATMVPATVSQDSPGSNVSYSVAPMIALAVAGVMVVFVVAHRVSTVSTVRDRNARTTAHSMGFANQILLACAMLVSVASIALCVSAPQIAPITGFAATGPASVTLGSMGTNANSLIASKIVTGTEFAWTVSAIATPTTPRRIANFCGPTLASIHLLGLIALKLDAKTIALGTVFVFKESAFAVGVQALTALSHSVRAPPLVLAMVFVTKTCSNAFVIAPGPGMHVTVRAAR